MQMYYMYANVLYVTQLKKSEKVKQIHHTSILKLLNTIYKNRVQIQWEKN